MTLKVGIVGCGKIADAHIEQVRATGLANVLAVCDSEPLMARQLSDRLSVPGVYSDMSKMITEQQLDVVHLATPPDSHPFLAQRALELGCHVFVEKPFANNAADATAIVIAAQKFQRKVCVNHMFLFETPYLLFGKELSGGSLGNIVHMNTSYGYDLAGDYGTAVLTDEKHWVHRLPGKLFHNVLDHMICKISPLLDDSPLKVSSHAYRRRPAIGNATIDALNDELRFEIFDGSRSVFGHISAHARPVTHDLDIFGSRNTVHMDFNARTLTEVARQTQKGSIGRVLPSFAQARAYLKNFRRNAKEFRQSEFHYFQGMRRLLTAFYLSIENQTPEPIPPRNIVRTCEIMDQIIESMDTAKKDQGASA